MYFMSTGVQDSRCYLESGGSVESFFVSEDLPVGSIVGNNIFFTPFFDVFVTHYF